MRAMPESTFRNNLLFDISRFLTFAFRRSLVWYYGADDIYRVHLGQPLSLEISHGLCEFSGVCVTCMRRLCQLFLHQFAR